MQITEKGHLTYCTNIHPGETWKEVFESLEKSVNVRQQCVEGDTRFGIGLRLSAQAAEQLGTGKKLEEFKAWLKAENCYVFTMNGFPYGGFHHTIVKDQVHAPDWTTEERLEYSKLLFSQLAQLLPDGQDGGVSTSPISYRFWHKTEEELAQVKEQGARNMIKLVEHLIALKEKTGKVLHLDIEPEPDGVLENSEEFISFFKEYLIEKGAEWLSESLELSHEDAKNAIYEHIQLCYDVCHFAVAYEEPQAVLDQIAQHGIKVGKIQISAAIKTKLKEEAESRKKILESLEPYNESTYLHQSVLNTKEGKLEHFPDLGPALGVLTEPRFTELRCHFHVPIFTDTYGALKSTQDEIVKVLSIWKAKPFTNHLEVETYTWEVLPERNRLNLTESISRELKWVEEIIEGA